MKILAFPIAVKGKNLRQLLPLAVVIVVLGVGGYFIVKNWQFLPKILTKLPAGVFVFNNKDKEPVGEELAFEGFALGDSEKPEEKEGKYVESAEKGEGMTHLARRVLKKYIQENQQNFEVTPEHKIYAEDYLAKKMDKGMLNLGEKMEFSEDLIKEAVQKAETLTPEQLQNLQQYSQLAPSLNY